MGFYTSRASIQGPTEYESDALPTEPLGLCNNIDVRMVTGDAIIRKKQHERSKTKMKTRSCKFIICYWNNRLRLFILTNQDWIRVPTNISNNYVYMVARNVDFLYASVAGCIVQEAHLCTYPHMRHLQQLTDASSRKALKACVHGSAIVDSMVNKAARCSLQ